MYIFKERITATQKSQSKGILIGLCFICKKIQCFADILARFIFIYTFFPSIWINYLCSFKFNGQNIDSVRYFFKSKKGEVDLLQKKREKVIIVIIVLLVIAVVGAAFLILSPVSGWEQYAKSADYVVVDGYNDIIENGKEKGLDDDQIWTELVAYSEVIKYPKKELEKAMQKNRENYEELAKISGYSNLESYLKKEMSLTLEEFEENSEMFCKNKVVEKLVLYRIAYLEEISIDESEYIKYLNDIMELNGFTDESFEQAYGCSFREYAENNEIEDSYLLDILKEKLF